MDLLRDSIDHPRYDRGQTGSGQERKDPLDGEYEPVDNCVNSVLGQVRLRLSS